MNIGFSSRILSAWVLSCAIAGGANATWPEDAGSPLSDTELAMLRGGFVGLDNLQISIGLEQRVAIDGKTLILNRLTIPDLNKAVDAGRIAARVEQALANALPTGNAAIVTSSQPGTSSPAVGAGSRVSSQVNAGQWMTVIQNRVNGTVIQSLQQLNIELNNLGAMYRLPHGIRGSIPVMP